MGQTREKKPSKRSLKAEAAVEPASQSLSSSSLLPSPSLSLSLSRPTSLAPAEDETIYDPSLVEVRHTETKGYALFATRRIPAGTLILQETPLIRLTRNDEEIELNTEHILAQRHRDLPKDVQRQYTKLHDSQKSDFSKIKSIYFSNCYNLTGDRSVYGGSCIGAIASRINHSCVPNVQFSFQESGDLSGSRAAGLMRFYAVKAIAKDREVTSNYESIFLTAVQRRGRLQMYYGFQCDCEACSGSVLGHGFWASSDDRRREMIRLKHEIESAGKQRDQDEVEGVIAALQRMEVLLVKEGLWGDPLARVYADLARWCIVANRRDEAVKWLSSEQRVCVMCFGTHSRRARDVVCRISELGIEVNPTANTDVPV